VSRSVEHYASDVIISWLPGESHRGTQFRIWATQRLRNTSSKVSRMDDERLKQAAAGITSTSLLARIRDIVPRRRNFGQGAGHLRDEH